MEVHVQERRSCGAAASDRASRLEVSIAPEADARLLGARLSESRAARLFLQPTTTMSNDDPRDPSAETKLSFPESWKTDTPGTFALSLFVS